MCVPEREREGVTKPRARAPVGHEVWRRARAPNCRHTRCTRRHTHSFWCSSGHVRPTSRHASRPAKKTWQANTGRAPSSRRASRLRSGTVMNTYQLKTSTRASITRPGLVPSSFSQRSPLLPIATRLLGRRALAFDACAIVLVDAHACRIAAARRQRAWSAAESSRSNDARAGTSSLSSRARHDRRATAIVVDRRPLLQLLSLRGPIGRAGACSAHAHISLNDLSSLHTFPTRAPQAHPAPPPRAAATAAADAAAATWETRAPRRRG